MPVVEGRTQPEDYVPASSQSEKIQQAAKGEPQPEPAEEDTDPIKRLEDYINADMNAWMEEVMPEGTRCIYIIDISVAPNHQGRGVGKRLLRWGMRFCDERGVFAWVHSSQGAWKMYEKSGFQIIRELDVDMDEYAPVPPPNEGPGAKWGHCVFRYMKYFPQTA